MKTFCFLFLIPGILFSQLRIPAVEISTQTINFGSKDIITFVIEPDAQNSTAWYISKSTAEWTIDPNPEISEEEIIGNNTLANRGFQVYPWADNWEPFWHAFNKITIFVDPYGPDPKTELLYFYTDHRDCGFKGGQGNNDLTIRYNKNDSDKVYFAPKLPIGESFWTDYDSVYEGGVINIWEVNEYGSHDISCFLPAPTGLNVDEQNNHPRITWSHDDDPNGTYYYQVWRLLTQAIKPLGTWYLIDTITDTTYIDYEVYIGNQSWGRAYYKIRANIDDLYSAYSEYDSISYQGLQKKSGYTAISDIIKEFKLGTNYPNPFNPVTQIAYSMPENSFIGLTVFDIHGKIVTTLKNGLQEAGNYTVSFNSKNLPSGIYLYRLNATGQHSGKKYTMTRRMLLLK